MYPEIESGCVCSGNGEGSQIFVLRGRAVCRCALDRRHWPTIERDGCCVDHTLEDPTCNKGEGGVPSGQASTLGLLFFKFIRAQPYTCLGIEWLTQGGVVYYFHVFIRAQSCTPVWELIG